MTIESNGQAFTFEGHLVNTDITLERDEYRAEFGHTVVGPSKYTINLEIIARDMEQHVL